RLRVTLQDPVWLDQPVEEPADVSAAIVVLEGPLAAAAISGWGAALAPERIALVTGDRGSEAARAADRIGAHVLAPGSGPAMVAALELAAEHFLVLGDDARPGWAEDARIARSHASAALGADAAAVRAAA